MISMAKKMGAPTNRHARTTASVVSPLIRADPCSLVNWWIVFSTITTVASTNSPMEMAIPDRDMMLLGTPT